MTAAMDHLPIRPLQVDHPLQKMRQDRGRTHAQQQVIGLSTRMIIAIPGRQPKSGRDRKQHVFIGSPGQEPGRALYSRACMACNRPGNPLVELGGGELPPRHHQCSLAGTISHATRLRVPNAWNAVWFCATWTWSEREKTGTNHSVRGRLNLPSALVVLFVERHGATIPLTAR